MGDGNVRCYVSLLSLMFVWDGVGGVADGNVRCYVILLSLMFVWDGVGGVGDGNIRCYVILLSGMGWVGWGTVTFVYAWMWRRDCKQSLYKSLGDLCGNM